MSVGQTNILSWSSKQCVFSPWPKNLNSEVYSPVDNKSKFMQNSVPLYKIMESANEINKISNTKLI